MFVCWLITNFIIPAMFIFFGNGAYYTSRPGSFAAIFDGRQIVVHVAIVLGALGAIFLEKYTSVGNYGNIVIISLLCAGKCMLDITTTRTSTNNLAD